MYALDIAHSKCHLYVDLLCVHYKSSVLLVFLINHCKIINIK